MTTSTRREFACCPGAAWAQAADFGHADGIEFTLGRCSACGRYWVHLWTPYSRDAGYVALDDAAAHELSTMAPGPDRKRRLAELFNPWGGTMDIQAEDDFLRTLQQARDEKAAVEVQIRGGQSLKGLVRAVGKEFAVIGPLSGRDFFDAHVRVADMSAICVQVRGR